MARVPMAVLRLKADDLNSNRLDNVADPNKDDIWKVEVEINSNLRGLLLYRAVDTGIPTWATYLRQEFGYAEIAFRGGAANSAAIIVPGKSCRYAFTFGYGLTLLDPKLIERRFGARIAAGIVPIEKLTNVNLKEISASSVFKNFQANVGVSFDRFGVDTDINMLTGIAGTPDQENQLFTKIYGTDAFYINPKDGVKHLQEAREFLDEEWDRKRYRTKGFDWIDQVNVVKDRETLDSLESRLEHDLGDRESYEFGPPAMVDEINIERFEMGPTMAPKTEFPNGDDLQESLQRARSDKVEFLKRKRIEARDHTGGIIGSWKAFDWVVWGKQVDDKHYLLQDGTFYVVEARFERRVDRYIERNIKSVPPKWDMSGVASSQDEFDHNKNLSRQLGRKAKLLDGILFHKSFRGHGSLEFCDVFDATESPNKLIHTKRYAESSSPLSHLFAQGSNSIVTLLNDENFFSEVRSQHGMKAHLEGAGQNPRKYVVVFLILTDKRVRPIVDLPFFAKATLYQKAKDLQARGVTVRAGMKRTGN